MLNWIVWNRTVWHFNCLQTKNYTYTELNCLKLNLALNDPKKVDTLLKKNPTNQSNYIQYKMYLHNHFKLLSSSILSQPDLSDPSMGALTDITIPEQIVTHSRAFYHDHIGRLPKRGLFCWLKTHWLLLLFRGKTLLKRVGINMKLNCI